jgi:hypothetical protein
LTVCTFALARCEARAVCCCCCCCRGTFRDVNGRVYRPDVVRLGSEEALSEEARQVGSRLWCVMLLYK